MKWHRSETLVGKQQAGSDNPTTSSGFWLLLCQEDLVLIYSPNRRRHE